MLGTCLGRGLVWLVAVCLLLWVEAGGQTAAAAPARVEVRKVGEGFQLLVDARPFYINGAGGSASKELLVRSGGNSVRLWGAVDIDKELDDAHKQGLKVAVGIWLEHKGAGPLKFDYANPAHLADQTEKVRAAVLKYKDHPAVLLWGLGNEMEGEKGDDAAVWKHVNDLARMVKQLDPNHPTMTVTAELGGERVASINRYCPDIDIHGINSYAGISSLSKRYRELGGVKPFIVTEFGPAGPWEVGKTPWGAPLEVSSTEKAGMYRNAWETTILPEKGKLGLGSYAFLWGNKEEATATWFGMKLRDGSKLEAVDMMTQLWTGLPVADPCPKLKSMTVDRNQIKPGDIVTATLEVSDPRGRPLKVEWLLTVDPQRYLTMGQFQKDATVIPEAVVRGDLGGAEIRMPTKVGPYWLYAYVRNDDGGAATMVVPLNVTEKPLPTSVKPNREPLILYGDDLKGPAPFAWSGWMGTTAAIKLDDKWTDNPHSGATCMRITFDANTGFGGIAGQNPPNDWGDLPGGLDISGATKLTFWARGENGGELVTFKMGILGADKKYADSASAETPEIRLSKQWKQYTIDLEGKDLRRVKTGFVWALSAHGTPVTFYLDDIRYE
jgi:hypothetical protein